MLYNAAGNGPLQYIVMLCSGFASEQYKLREYVCIKILDLAQLRRVVGFV